MYQGHGVKVKVTGTKSVPVCPVCHWLKVILIYFVVNDVVRIVDCTNFKNLNSSWLSIVLLGRSDCSAAVDEVDVTVMTALWM